MPAIPIIGLVIAAGSAVYSGVQQRNQANNEEAQQRMNNDSTMKAAIESYSDLTPHERDADKEEARGGIKAQSDYLRSVGDMNVMSGASGTYGGSVDSMLKDLKTTRGRNISDIITNRGTELDNIKAQAESIRYGARANMQTRVFNKPSVLGVGLNAVGAGASGYEAGRTIQIGLEQGQTAAPVGPAISGGQ